uniref:Uncharacterized protein n=1 Tax=Eutreptiella gymnastica TaxID=73025 RepID=A0A7S1IJV3_9EUGL|mmetsp:Transcript_23824/g.42936  ORF Transcript_23824/g.42936 Transcript_23824/m.42936 type:complete len:125 (+) Transcript_23824:257-631(+)
MGVCVSDSHGVCTWAAGLRCMPLHTTFDHDKDPLLVLQWVCLELCPRRAWFGSASSPFRISDHFALFLLLDAPAWLKQEAEGPTWTRYVTVAAATKLLADQGVKRIFAPYVDFGRGKSAEFFTC